MRLITLVAYGCALTLTAGGGAVSPIDATPLTPTNLDDNLVRAHRHSPPLRHHYNARSLAAQPKQKTMTKKLNVQSTLRLSTVHFI
jgi:hypothetical protein